MNEQNTLFKLPECPKNDIPKEKYYGKPRIQTPIRNQTEMRIYCVDDLIPKDHKVRAVWKYVESLDLSKFMLQILSTAGNAGRPATDPRLLLSLWLYATIEGIVNGRVIEKYCNEHNAFKWLCGEVNVNYHSINDFRINNRELMDDLLTQSVAVLLNAKVIDLESISQDGMRVKANASSSSFRREETLESYLVIAQEYIKSLNEETEENPNIILDRKKCCELSRAKEQETRIQKSLEELENLRKKKNRVVRSITKSTHQKKKNKQELQSQILKPEK